jgi:hypothetical protein
MTTLGPTGHWWAPFGHPARQLGPMHTRALAMGIFGEVDFMIMSSELSLANNLGSRAPDCTYKSGTFYVRLYAVSNGSRSHVLLLVSNKAVLFCLLIWQPKVRHLLRKVSNRPSRIMVTSRLSNIDNVFQRL